MNIFFGFMFGAIQCLVFKRVDDVYLFVGSSIVYAIYLQLVDIKHELEKKKS